MADDMLPPAEVHQGDDAPPPHPPHGYKPLLVLSVGILTAFVGISGYVLWDGKASPEVRGAIVQTWTNLAICVTSFWFGSTVTAKINRLKDGR